CSSDLPSLQADVDVLVPAARFEGRIRFIIDRLAGRLGLGGWTLFVSELPEQLQRQCWLRKDADRFGSPDIGRLQVTLQPQDFCDPAERGHEPDDIAGVGFGDKQFQAGLPGPAGPYESFGFPD